MAYRAANLVAGAIAVFELVSIGAALPASAESAVQERREIKRQQQIILKQQKLIRENQRLIEAQQRQLDRPSTASARRAVDERSLPKGLATTIFGCPNGSTYLLTAGCVPVIAVQ